MTAPLSTFMTQLMDESINRQGDTSTTVNFYQGSEESTNFSTTSTVSAHSEDSTVMTDNLDSESKASSNIPSPSRSTKENNEPPTKKTTTNSSVVPNKMALKKCRKSFSVVTSPLKQHTNSDETSLSMASINRQGSSNLLQTSGATSGSSGTEFSTSLTNFMTQLLNDSDIDKLIQEGDASTEGDERNNANSSLITNDNANAPRPSILSKGAANVLASAVRTIQKEESNRSNALMKDSSDADADVESSNGNNNYNSNVRRKLARPSISDLSLEAAKECLESMAKIDALITGNTAAADPYNLVKTMATTGGNGDLAKLDYRKGLLSRSNSDGSISLLSSNKEDLQKSSSQSLSISGLRQELKKSASVGHLRQQMKRLQSCENIYSGSTELDYGKDKEEESTVNQEENSKPLCASTDDIDEGKGEEESAQDLDASGISKSSKEGGRRPRSSTPRSRRSKSASATKRRRAKSATHDKSKRAPSADTKDASTLRSPSPAVHKKSSKSSRGRTPRTPSKSGRKRTTSSSKKEKSRGHSASMRSPSVTPRSRSQSQGRKVRSRSQSKTPRSRSQSKTPRKRRSSEIIKSSTMKEAMKDVSTKDASMKRDKSHRSKSTRKSMDESSKRDHSSGRSKRTSTKTGECPATPRVKSPSAAGRTRRASTMQDVLTTPKTPSSSARKHRASTACTKSSARSPSVSRTPREHHKRSNSKEAPRTPRTPKGLRASTKTPKTPSSSGKRISTKPKTASRSKSFDTGVEPSETPKTPLRRTKTSTSDQLLITATPAMPSVRRRGSLTSNKSDMDGSKMDASSKSHTPSRRGDMDGSKMDASSKSHTPARRRNSLTSKIGESHNHSDTAHVKPSKAPLRRNQTVGHGHDTSSVMSPMTPSARRRNSLTAAGMSTTPRRNAAKDAASSGKEPRITRRGGVSTTKPPRRQQSDPAPTVQSAAAIVAEEAAQAAKEMEKRRVRSKSAGGKLSRKGHHHHANGEAQGSKPANRRGHRQRSNQQAQNALRQAVIEEIKAKEPVNPLAETPEGVKEATWISRRKSRLFLSPQQSPARLSSAAGV